MAAARVLAVALALAPLGALASFFSHSPCGVPCASGCGGGAVAPPPNYDFHHHVSVDSGCPQVQPCPIHPPPVCPEHPPCPVAAAVAPPVLQQNSYVHTNSIVDQFVQPLQQLQQPSQYAQPEPDVYPGGQQPTVIYLDQQNGGRTAGGNRPQVVYQSLPSGGSRLIVPPGSEVYTLNSGTGASYQYEQPTVVYRTDKLPTNGYAAVEQNIDELDVKALEWGIPLTPTKHKRGTLEAIEKMVDDAEIGEETIVRKARALTEDFGELISSEEEVEMIGDKKKKEKKEKKSEQKDIKAAASKNKKQSTEKSQEKRSQRSKSVHEEVKVKIEEVEDESDSDMDRRKCNSRILYEIMMENMNESSASSKRNINTVAEAELGTSIDVVCSRGHFSYVFSSNLYCEASKGHVTCIAFRQAPPTPVEE